MRQSAAALTVQRARQAGSPRGRHCGAPGFARSEYLIDVHPFHDKVHKRKLTPNPICLRPMLRTELHDVLNVPDQKLSHILTDHGPEVAVPSRRVCRRITAIAPIIMIAANYEPG